METATGVAADTVHDVWGIAVVLVVLATSNLFVPDLGGGRLGDPTTLSLGAAALIAAVMWAREFRLGLAHAVLGSLLVTFLPGLLMAADHSYGHAKVFGILASLAIVAATMHLFAREQVRAAFLLVLTATSAAVSLALLLFGESDTFPGARTIFEKNPIGVGRMAALGALFALLALPRQRRARLAGLIAMVAVCGTAAFLTDSRGPIVAVVVAALVAVAPGRVDGRKAALAAGGVVVGALVAVTVALTVAADALSTFGSGRVELWRETVALAFRKPFGVGFGDLYGNIPIEPRETVAPNVQYPHNIFIEAASEGGWIALLGLVGALAVSAYLLWRGADTTTGRALLALWVYAVVNACLSSDLVGNRLVWVAIGAGLAAWTTRPLPRRFATSHRLTTAAPPIR